MNLALSIALAYLKNRKRQSVISILGVMMGVGFFIAIAAMMKGFQGYFIEKIIDVSPHIIIKDEYRNPPKQPIEKLFNDASIELSSIKPKDELRGIRGAERIVEALVKTENFHIAPILQSQAFIRYGGRDESTTLVGIDPALEREVSNVEKDLIKGSLNSLITNSNGIILGIGLAKKLNIRMNSKISIVSPAGLVLKVKVVGIFDTGITSLDNFQSYMLLKKVQVLQDREKVINQIRIKLHNVDEAEDTAKDLEKRFGYLAESWKETNSNVFSIFKIQNGIMYSTVTAILIVAGFGIFNIISTIVNEKNKDIAILKSMGFSTVDIQKIFFYQGIIVGVIGTLLGWILGFFMIEFLETIEFNVDKESFIRTNGLILYKSFYQYLFAGILAVIASSISALIPARKAASLNPVEIIRGAS